MRIILNGRDISYINNDRVVGFETDNDVNEFICVVEDSIPTPAWGYKLDVKAKLGDKTFYNTINLTKSKDADNEYGVLLGANMLPQGKCLCNIRRISGKKVYNSDVFEMWVKKPVLSYCGAYQEDGFIPSEFFQIEQRMDEINNLFPSMKITRFTLMALTVIFCKKGEYYLWRRKFSCFVAKKLS